MLSPRRNKWIYIFFSWYIDRIIRTDFKSVNFNRISIAEDRSILLLANHLSWWDGFVIFHINKLFFRRKFHVMVSEDNFEKVWFLKYMGAFPVKNNSRSIIETLEYAGELLNDPGNLVLVFPQGKLYSGHITDVNFQKGLIKMIGSSEKKFQYVFAATFFDYFDSRKPTVSCYLSVWYGAEFTSLQLVKSEYNKHYELSRQKQIASPV